MLSACGGSDSRKDGSPLGAKTPAVTVTVVPKSGKGARARQVFCSQKGKDLAEVNQDISKAAGEGDADALAELANRTLRLAKDAPAGAGCAVVPLQTLIQTYTTTKGAEAKAELRRLRAFGRKHDLVKPRF
jgi:hypothetical protein